MRSSCYSNVELVQVTLTSPQGTWSTLLPYRKSDSTCEFKEWAFTFVHFWGENPGSKLATSVDFSSPVGTVVVALYQLHLYMALNAFLRLYAESQDNVTKHVPTHVEHQDQKHSATLASCIVLHQT